MLATFLNPRPFERTQRAPGNAHEPECSRLRNYNYMNMFAYISDGVALMGHVADSQIWVCISALSIKTSAAQTDMSERPTG